MVPGRAHSGVGPTGELGHERVSLLALPIAERRGRGAVHPPRRGTSAEPVPAHRVHVPIGGAYRDAEKQPTSVSTNISLRGIPTLFVIIAASAAGRRCLRTIGVSGR